MFNFFRLVLVLNCFFTAFATFWFHKFWFKLMQVFKLQKLALFQVILLVSVVDWIKTNQFSSCEWIYSRFLANYA